jgi:hypothetical protein
MQFSIQKIFTEWVQQMDEDHNRYYSYKVEHKQLHVLLDNPNS